MAPKAIWKKSIELNSDYCADLVFLKHLKACGFAGIDINFSDKFFYDPDTQIELISRNLLEAGLVCAQGHLPTYGLFDDSRFYDEEREKNYSTALWAMSKLNIKWGVHHLLSEVNGGFGRTHVLQDNLERLKRYLEAAERYGVGIAVENLPTFPDHPEYPFYSSLIEDQCEVIDRMDSPLVGACWDFGHKNLNIQQQEISQREALNILGSRLKVLHVQNNFRTRDNHLPPAIGSIDWKDAVAGLRDIGFDGFFSIECRYIGPYDKIYYDYVEFCAKSTEEILQQEFLNG